MGRAEKAGGEIRGHHGQPQPEARQTAPGHRLCLLAPGHPGHRHCRRGHLHPGGPGRQRYQVSLGEHPEVPGGRAETSGTLPGHHHFHPHGAPDLRQGGPGQGAQAGRGHQRGLPGPAGLHGRLLRQLLQPLRPPVAGLRPGRGGIPGRTPNSWASSTCATRTATPCP